MDIVDRLKTYMGYLSMSSSQFADSANITRPTLSQIITGRNKKISNEVFSKIHKSHPDLNMMWLMFGDGSMLVDGSGAVHVPADDAVHGSLDECPALSIDSVPSDDGLFAADMETDCEISSVGDLEYSRICNPESGMTGTSRSETPDTQVSFNSGASDRVRRISSIMVFYSDKSYEIFKPCK